MLCSGAVKQVRHKMFSNLFFCWTVLASGAIYKQMRLRTQEADLTPVSVYKKINKLKDKLTTAKHVTEIQTLINAKRG